MLNKLTIRNYAIIDAIEIDLQPGLTIMTGETGAGKSIILGALSLLLGQRADSKSLFNQKEKCVIEGLFTISSYELQGYFSENDLDYSETSILRREISPDGRSRSFINDTPVNLTLLKSLGEKLVDVHSQHETLELNSGKFQLMVVDSFCKHPELLNEHYSLFKKYRVLSSVLSDLKEKSRQAEAEKDYLQFQFDELEKAEIKYGEQNILEEELNTLTHADEIKRNLGSIFYALQEDEKSIQTQLKTIVSGVNSLEKFSSRISELAQRLKSLQIELTDISAEIEDTANTTSVDPERLQIVQDRLDILYKLQQKHRVTNNVELIDLQSEISEKLLSFSSLDSSISLKDQELLALIDQLIKTSKQLSVNRKKVIPEIEKQVSKMLAEVGMPDASLQIQNTFSEPEQFNLNGIDSIVFLFSANKGYKLVELNKVASGGELSRLMLCIKSLTAQHTALPTIIFDEIDTGVSGEVAMKVGNIMQKLSEALQVIAITHLPQIASKGDTHLFVYKEVKSAQTFTNIKVLNEKERIIEIAKMLSGDDPGENAISNAKELLSI